LRYLLGRVRWAGPHMRCLPGKRQTTPGFTQKPSTTLPLPHRTQPVDFLGNGRLTDVLHGAQAVDLHVQPVTYLNHGRSGTVMLYGRYLAGQIVGSVGPGTVNFDS